MHNEDVPLGSNVIPILVAAQCYWMRCRYVSRNLETNVVHVLPLEAQQ